MQISKKKTIATAISLFLILAMTASLVALPAFAQAPPVIQQGHSKSYAFIGAIPDPALAGEEVLLHIGITQQLQITQDKYRGLTVTVTRPDGTTETLGPFNTDSTGGTGVIYVPATVGTYKLQTHFPAQWYNFTSFDIFAMQLQIVNIYYEADDSPILELVVTEGTPNYWPGVPLPTEYWTRPIDSQNREWNVMSGSWLSPSSIFGNDPSAGSGQDDAPETAHVLWQKPLQIGGLAGGVGISEQAGIFPGDAYEGKFSNSLVIMGVLIYPKFDSAGGNAVDNWNVAVDLHTGETLWEKKLLDPTGAVVVPQFGQIMYWKSYNTQGVHAYLWAGVSGGFFGAASSRLEAFDPYTGRWLFSFTDMPSGNRMYGPNGEILIYTINLAAGYMTFSTSPAVRDAYWGTTENNPSFGSWQPQGKTINATGPTLTTSATPFGLNGYQKNITIPKGLPGSVSYQYYDDTIFGYYRGNTIGFFGTISFDDPPYTIWAFNAKTGALKFNKTYAAPAGNVSIATAAGSAEERVVTLWSKELTKFYAYNLDTGNFMWETQSQHYLDVYAMYPLIRYGKLYSNGMSGVMYTYDAQTGQLLWNYTYADPFKEVLWSNYWSSLRPRIISDGKIYLGQSEHSVNQPQPRGAPFVCLDAETGEVIWSVYGMFRQTDWGGSAVMGDSIIATMDTYDQQVYAIGKGPSATTVTASPKVSAFTGSILIEGYVTDTSPGTEEYARTARFPNGVPAVSDESMSTWMQYVYKQWARPTDVTGVEVSIDVIDANGNFRNIGTATSNADGFYSFQWCADIEGKYTVIASFGGSKAFYGSHATTAFIVDPAPEATPEPTQAPTSIADQYFLPMTGGMIAAIIAAAVAIILVLRKR